MKKGLDNLEIYKLAEELEVLVYKETSKFPEDEKYRSVDQLRRSSSSVTDNIAEGYGRYSFQDKISKFYIARGEAEETRKGLGKAYRKGFISKETSDFFDKKYTQIIKQINAYINFLRRQKQKYTQSPSTQSPSTQSPSTRGFTLIELMVSLSVLVMAIVSATGVYLQVIGTREKSLSQLHLQEDGQYLMSLMVKDIRTGRIDYASYPGETATSPEDELYLLDFLSPQNQIRYKSDLTTSGNCVVSPCVLKRCLSIDCTLPNAYQNITMTNSSVERLDFYISPTADPFQPRSSTYEHPRVTIVLKLKSLIEKPGAKDLILQQTVPQRYSQRR